jgi:glycosyltransferase involved in cell wall biosynthesis
VSLTDEASGEVPADEAGAPYDEILHGRSLLPDAEGAECQNVAMSHPVSVQICTLNEEANIGECLETVFANDPEDVLIIDGGSTDRTVVIAEALGARVLAPGKLGLGPSRQLGYLSARTRYVAFVDADDRLGPDWLTTMVREMQAGGYAALQSSLRAPDNGNWWSQGWNQYFIESVKPVADTNMVGRPALFLTEALQSDPSDLTSLDEDTHLSRRFELQGLRQGIGTAVAYRHCEETLEENFKKWQSYGRGYRGFVDEHPDRRNAILKHMLVTVPFSRSWRPVLRGQVTQPVFGVAMALNISYGYANGHR